MKRKWYHKYLIYSLIILYSCNSGNSATSYNYKYGEGVYNSETIIFLDSLNGDMIKKGAIIFNNKCSSCHKTSEDKLIGPGLKGITNRRTFYWIMNFVSNPEPMIDKDTTLHKLVQLCLIEMPDTHLTEEEVRSILEFFRYLDKQQ